MARPLIGLIPLWDDEKQSIWMLPGYVEGILAAGGIPITLPYTADPEVLQQSCAVCDGFLLTGGHDVDPALYGSEPSPACGTICPVRDRLECYVLSYALEHDLPVLGICRGIQFLNAALGGTLYQHLPEEHPSKTEHHQSPPYDRPIHRVDIVPGTPLHELLGVTSLSVNSYHHQAIRDKAPALSVMAVSEDGLIEAVCLPERHYVWAVQWHPEFSFRADPASSAILRSLVLASDPAQRR